MKLKRTARITAFKLQKLLVLKCFNTTLIVFSNIGKDGRDGRDGKVGGHYFYQGLELNQRSL